MNWHEMIPTIHGELMDYQESGDARLEDIRQRNVQPEGNGQKRKCAYFYSDLIVQSPGNGA